MRIMSWRSKGLPLTIFAIFIIQIMSPTIQFPIEELASNESSEAQSVGFSSGSGHDLEGDLLSLDGKNWTVRGESILDHWRFEIQSESADGAIDLIVTDAGMGYACSINGSDINLHTIGPNGTFETMLVESLSGDVSDDCAIAINNQDRIQVIYNVGDDLRLARLAEINAVYLQKTWHLRTIAEDVYSSGLTISFDSESKTHILFQDTDSALHHLWFNKAFWNHTILDNGPIGSDIEVEIDSSDMFHVVFTNSAEGEVHLLKFNDTMEVRQVLARGDTITSAIGMDLDSNNIEQISYSKSDGIGNNTISLLRSLAGKDTGRIDPDPKWVIDYDDDSPEGIVTSGDLNGDGYDDLVYTDSEGRGTISIHYGSPDGPGTLADRIFVGSTEDSMLGTGVAIGDFNCDGIDDLASSEPGLAINNSGHISIRLGSANGVSNTTWWEMNGSDDDNLGWSLTSLGDVESDGCGDLAVVADKMILEDTITPTLSQNGLVMILKGNSTAMAHHANITQTGSGTMFGRQVIGNGDINGDGFLDMVISNSGTADSPTGYSSVEFFLGNSSGINSTASTIHAPLSQGKLYGTEMSFVGDVHGDGYDDVLISELFADGTLYHAGKVHMWAGSSSGPISGSWTLQGSSANSLLGQTISPAGDINEDGYDDFFLMAPSSTKSGKVGLYLGSQNGPRTDVQIFAQGSTGENVGLNIHSGMDMNGDGMGEIVYSSRDLTSGQNYGPVLTIMSERDWEYVDFSFAHPIADIEMHTTLRGSPSLMVMLTDSSVELLESTLDGTPSGRWVTRDLFEAEVADMGISSSGKPLLLSHSSSIGNPDLMITTLDGNTGLDYTLSSGNGLGKMMSSATDSNGHLRIGHASPDFSSIFYTEEGVDSFTTSTVRTSIDLLYPIGMHLDSNEMSRMVYVDDDDHMVRLATLNGTWDEISILNTTIGDDFDSIWDDDDALIFAQIAISNSTTMLQVVEYQNNTTTITDLVSANLSSSFELTQLDEKLVLSIMDYDKLTVFELTPGNNWSIAKELWLLGATENHSLAMQGQVIMFDANNTIQGLLIEDGAGNWTQYSIDIPDSMTQQEIFVSAGRWHVTSSNSLNQMVWTTGTISQNSPQVSTVFPSITTDYRIPIDEYGGKLTFAYSQSSTGDFLLMKLVSDLDRDLIPDSHDEKPMIGNQWEDSDTDGYGDNPLGPEADSCISEQGTSTYDVFGCIDYDNDGWSNAADDCSSDDGMSWWGSLGCDDYDQDGWVDDGVIGDRYPTNWKQALDSDRDSFGDNHGPDCCDVTVLGETETNTPDLFPYNRMQWEDEDNDGYGDNESDQEFGDKCWWVQGFSWRDRLGCVDTDGDGASDPSDFGTFREWNESHGADWWPEDATQWADSDGDGFGDNSSDDATNPDKFPNNSAAANDTDNDGYPNNWTALENATNHAGLFLDYCPNIFGNSTSAFVSGQVIEYYGCTDSDGDGREDLTDAFPENPTQYDDTDGDGWGNNQNGDDPDACPLEFGDINGTKPDGTPGVGCPIEGEEVDTDQDSIPDDADDCQDTQAGQIVDSAGCSEYQKDDDQDDVSNAEDMCSDTPVGETVDDNGCSESQSENDSDGDGINDPSDLCPDTDILWIVNSASVNSDGCAPDQLDDDGDGVSNLYDECPDTEPGLPVLAFTGCFDEFLLDQDIDGDGYKGQYYYYPENDTHVGDAFFNDSSQWHDKDGDGYGDNPSGNNSDFCPEISGTSTMKNHLGCLDTDGDGYHDYLGDDAKPNDSTQWADADRDEFGDNPDGNNPDLCPNSSPYPPLYLDQARANFGCADYESDSDGDGVYDDKDACMNTKPGAEVYPSGCAKEVAAEPVEEDDKIMGMDPMIFFAIAGGGGLVVLILLVFIVSRIRGGDEFDLEDDDDWYDDDDDDDDEDDFMSSILGNQSRVANSGPTRGPGPSRGPSRGPSKGPPGSSGPSRGPPSGPSPSRGPPGAGPGGPSRGPPGGAVPSRGPGGPMPSRGPDPRGPARGKKVAKRKPIGSDGKVRKAKVVIDPDLFSQEELADRSAAIDWTKGALKDGDSERSILMQLQTTGWSAPQSRAIIDLSKQ